MTAFPQLLEYKEALPLPPHPMPDNPQVMELQSAGEVQVKENRPKSIGMETVVACRCSLWYLLVKAPTQFQMPAEISHSKSATSTNAVLEFSLEQFQLHSRNHQVKYSL